MTAGVRGQTDAVTSHIDRVDDDRTQVGEHCGEHLIDDHATA
jgi:hypothetical protein